MNAPVKNIAELHRAYLRKTSPWNDERIAKLTELFHLGLSASRIADQLGDVTRNGIIGKLHRLGLKRDVKPVRIKLRRRQPSKAKPPARPVAARIVILKAKGEPKMSVKLVINEPIIDRSQAFICTDDTSISFEQLPSVGLCKWPYDVQDEPTRYCGVKAIEGASWCTGHARRVWQARERA